MSKIIKDNKCFEDANAENVGALPKTGGTVTGNTTFEGHVAVNSIDHLFIGEDSGSTALVTMNGVQKNKIGLCWINSALQLTIDNTVIGYLSTSATSDERLKTEIIDINENVIKAIGEVKLKQFKLKRNNPDNKISFGVIAQDLISAFEKYNLDINSYSLVKSIVFENEVEYYIVDYEQFNILRIAYIESKIS